MSSRLFSAKFYRLTAVHTVCFDGVGPGFPCVCVCVRVCDGVYVVLVLYHFVKLTKKDVNKILQMHFVLYMFCIKCVLVYVGVFVYIYQSVSLPACLYLCGMVCLSGSFLHLCS